MLVKVIKIKNGLAVCEFDNGAILQRKYIPIQLLDTTKLGPVHLAENVWQYGVYYSTVDLVTELGDYVGMTSIATLESELRRAGLWLREDYRRYPSRVETVVKQQRVDNQLDAATVINAALRHGG